MFEPFPEFPRLRKPAAADDAMVRGWLGPPLSPSCFDGFSQLSWPSAGDVTDI
jgi:hypothetical protein